GGAAAAELSWLRRDAAAGVERAQATTKEHPDAAAAWLALGVSAITARQPELALPALERCVELEGGLSARPLMFRAQLLAARAEPEARWRALAPFEHALRVSRGCSPRILAARAALAQRDAAPWSLRALRAARAYEPRRAEVYVWTGLLRIRAGAPRAEVDALWRRVLAIDAAYRFPKSAQDAYRQRYGEELRLERR
ncbi:MAG TPA: hypothetical protein DEA08_05545, partial [Planctomycetes bacterium]|nr:hypothetical protein [Planctomycetota bacterium]